MFEDKKDRKKSGIFGLFFRKSEKNSTESGESKSPLPSKKVLVDTSGADEEEEKSKEKSRETEDEEASGVSHTSHTLHHHRRKASSSSDKLTHSGEESSMHEKSEKKEESTEKVHSPRASEKHDKHDKHDKHEHHSFFALPNFLAPDHWKHSEKEKKEKGKFSGSLAHISSSGSASPSPSVSRSQSPTETRATSSQNVPELIKRTSSHSHSHSISHTHSHEKTTPHIGPKVANHKEEHAVMKEVHATDLIQEKKGFVEQRQIVRKTSQERVGVISQLRPSLTAEQQKRISSQIESIRGQCDQFGCACEKYEEAPVQEVTDNDVTQPADSSPRTLSKRVCVCGHELFNHVPEDESFDDLAWLDDRLQKAAIAEDPLENIIAKFESAKSPDKLQPWELDPTELKFEGLLGEGVTARVFQGEFRGQEVAIKVFKGILDEKTQASFEREFEIMSNVRSPHVVFFFGACLQPMLTMVMEMCHKGSLCSVLQDPEEDISWSRVLKVSEASVKGIHCLHSWKPPIVHRDLKSLNLLIDSNWNVKVGDFGLSRFTAGAESTLVKIRGTYAYCAPEVYFGHAFSPKADVYSLGIILWELVTRCITGEYQQPYVEFSKLVYDFQIIIQTARNGLRPTIPPSCPQTLASLIGSCWSENPDKRPATGEILEIIRNSQKEYKANKAKWDSIIQKHPQKKDDLE